MFEPVWRSLEQQVEAGWAPGLTAGIRYRGKTEYFATGRLSFEGETQGTGAGDEPMRTDTRFRIASLSKPIGGALALSMVADGLFALDDPVAPWLPELADPRVLVAPDAPLDQTVPADKPITVRHLLAMTIGLGAFFDEPPVAKAFASVGSGPVTQTVSHDEYMARLAAVPLAYQPGTRWMYHTGIDVLSVLMARVAGTPLHAVLEERITRPLGLTSTSFQADGATLPTSYRPTADGGVEIFPEYDGGFAEPPLFETFGGGLVSTVEDYLTFLGALADGRVIPDELLKEMTGDQLSDEEKRGTTEMGGEALSWGLGVGVDVAVTKPWTAVGRYGWTGGAGTSGYTDPSRDLIGVVLSQRFMSGPRDDFSYFWGPVAEVAGK